MYTASPKDIEKYHLYFLLLNVPDEKSFTDSRAVNGEVFNTFQSAARSDIGLLADDIEWYAAMTEAALTQMPSYLRQLFCVLIAFSGVSDLFQLWLDLKESMAQDYLYRYQQDPRNANEFRFEISEEMYEHCLLDLNDILADHRHDLKTMEGFAGIFPAIDSRANRNTYHSNTYERMHSLLFAESHALDPDLLPFNDSQALLYNVIESAAFLNDPQGPRVFFVDGPGGTGKTYVFNALFDCPFGGCLMVFGGDFRQVLPAILMASRSFVVGRCLNKASFWPQVHSMQLHTNMKVQQALQSNNSSLTSTFQQFSQFLLNVGQGDIPTVVLPNNIPSDFICIPQEMIVPGDNLFDLLKSVYPDIANHVNDPQYFIGRAILTSMNRDVKTINELLLDCIQGHKVSYVSTDRACYDEDQLHMPVEILNTIEGGSLPPHVLDLKIGSPIMDIRNIDPATGVCNGTCLVVNSLGTNVIEAVIATGSKAGNIALIPKIKFVTLATEGVSHYDFERIQFPLRLAFAMTINMS